MIQYINNIKYSLVVSYNKEFVQEDITKIKELLLKGIKVIIILNKYINIDIVRYEIKNKLDNVEEFEKYRFLKIYNINTDLGEEDLHIVDGQGIDKLDKIHKNINDFNFEQYKAEHLKLDENILIEASAGTGKTTIMIDRILYLLHMDESLKFSDITMLTFTREATQNMKEKLSEKILTKYKLTKDEKYLRYIENASSINIKTIHSFSKDLISKLGMIVGYGSNVKIRSFKHDKNEIISNVVNKYYKSDGNFKNEGVKSTLKMPLYDFIKLINVFWSKLESKAIPYIEIEKLDWGQSYNYNSKTIHDIIVKIFKDIEDEYTKLKYNENAIGLGGIIRDLDFILDNEIDIKNDNESKIKYKLNDIKYLFIDEFQDTDDTQIKLIHWFYKNLDTKVFAVGDIKQSIYRFRGTNDTAFDELEDKIKNIKKLTLVKNYRTSKDIVNRLNPIFSTWDNLGLLSYSDKDKIIPMNNGNGKYIDIKNEINHEDRLVRCFNYYQQQFDKYKENNDYDDNINDSTTKIVTLVRSNYEVDQIKTLCEENNVLCYVEAGGTFFISDAVKDFMALIGAYLFYDEPIYKMNFIETPYFKNEKLVDYKELCNQDGDKIKLNKVIDDLLNDESNYTKYSYHEYKNKFRINPIMQVIKRMIEDECVINNYYNKRRNELERNSKVKNVNYENINKMAFNQAILYEKNLNKLLEMINDKFDDEFCSLYKLHEYILLNIKTNRDEDEERLDDSQTFGYIHCMTVHKAKGLEFDTVILPYITNSFLRNMGNEILFCKENEGYIAGWKIGVYQNTNYNNLKNKENAEILKEESRLLYVALTRAINNLVCIEKYQRSINNINIYPRNWSDLLKGI